MIEQPKSPALEPDAPTAASLRGLLDSFAVDDTDQLAPDELVDQLTALEAVKSAAAARQARLAVALDRRQRQAEAEQGVPSERRGRGVAGQVALARHESPFRGRAHLGLAKALLLEMPATLAALTAGQISEWRAMIMVRETATLSRADRAEVDAQLAPRLSGWGDQQVAAEAKSLGYRLDPSSAVRRVRGARGDRRVTIRPAPDTMTRLCAFLPVEQGVAVHAALTRLADRAKQAGDARSRGQIMADELVARVTGQDRADEVPLTVNLVMGHEALFGPDDHPAHLDGFGPVPASTARQLIRDSAAGVWVRRLFTRPDDTELAAVESRSRAFPAALRDLIVFRDRTCRTPWCDALIRHSDHVVDHADGGPTSLDNGQGLCEACNYAKSQPGWSAEVTWLDPERAGPARRHTIRLITPTGHTYTSAAPDPPGSSCRPPDRPAGPAPRPSRLEAHLLQLLAA